MACRGATAFFGKREGWRYARCSQCGTIQLDPAPSTDQLAAAYVDYSGAGHYEASADAARRVSANHYKTLLASLRAHRLRGPVLDYGSGWGGLLEVLQSDGVRCTGLDWNREMVESCRQRGLPVILGDMQAVTQQRFGAITLCTVFELLVDHDRWLQAASEVLEPGGLLVSLNPTAGFARLAATLLRLGRRQAELPAVVDLYSPPWPPVFFSLGGMRQLFARNGFELLEVRFTPSGRKGGGWGALQAILERINRVGWRLVGPHWPLQVCHTFVFRKITSP